MFNFNTKDFHRLVFCVQTTRKLKETCEETSSSLSPQAIASWQSKELIHKLKTCDDLRSQLARALNFKFNAS